LSFADGIEFLGSGLVRGESKNITCAFTIILTVAARNQEFCFTIREES